MQMCILSIFNGHMWWHHRQQPVLRASKLRSFFLRNFRNVLATLVLTRMRLLSFERLFSVLHGKELDTTLHTPLLSMRSNLSWLCLCGEPRRWTMS
jgi:hypothetical protein